MDAKLQLRQFNHSVEERGRHHGDPITGHIAMVTWTAHRGSDGYQPITRYCSKDTPLWCRTATLAPPPVSDRLWLCLIGRWKL
ncbi:hypothetical protein AAFF_G00317610 [Aldrovandia affinis]|uniref:Uncharacterized protein n=1 Tax=Aldrovandia affinis TaxID=143900 RepID=A0AAD7W0I4_9TELE|nr:hypothetical protein AAFF_G00317610 [Aldrovandia affinis]